ncbi:hypothetical protein [Inquilinus sp. CAU 1745]|uniref:hypothetical protein n=1 Tax=Inquilinus sp. CAU 1745 TaxID=3140369 RepID=UPI00325AACBE
MLPLFRLQRVADAEMLRARIRARAAAIRFGVYLFAGLLGLVGVGFFLLAGFLALAKSQGLIVAALVMGGIVLILALLLALLARPLSGRRLVAAADIAANQARADLKADTAQLGLLAGGLGASAGAGGRRWFSANRGGVLIAAILAGVAASMFSGKGR